MPNEEHLAILDEGVGIWNYWRKRHPHSFPPDLRDADLERRDLQRIDFRGVTLDRANLHSANLSHADLSSSTIGLNLVHYTNLKEANLELADLREANLADANFVRAQLYLADLRRADLTGANFEGANLTAAKLRGAQINAANLRKVDLTRARVTFAVFQSAILEGAQFQDAHIEGTIFADCDLSYVKGLDLVKHSGPSMIGLDTIYKSRGKIPESFLRGCGVPENFIQYMPSLVDATEGIQFYSCFISYSSKDDEFARRLHKEMRDAHLRVWFAPEDIQGGKKLHEQIEAAIRIYDKLLIVLSEASLQSEWVITELRNARKAERQSGKRKLFPVRLVDFETLRNWECFDADSGKDLAVELREYFIPDFSNWKNHDQFEAAFSRLLKDLRAEEPAK